MHEICLCVYFAPSMAFSFIAIIQKENHFIAVHFKEKICAFTLCFLWSPHSHTRELGVIYYNDIISFSTYTIYNTWTWCILFVELCIKVLHLWKYAFVIDNSSNNSHIASVLIQVPVCFRSQDYCFWVIHRFLMIIILLLLLKKSLADYFESYFPSWGVHPKVCEGAT